MLPLDGVAAGQQQAGSIRGVVYDKEFDVPLAAAQVQAVETGQKTLTTDQGHFVLSQVPPGRYTLVFTKEGYVRQVKTDVVVNPGALTDVDVELAGEFTEMDEFVVQDIMEFGAGTEGALLKMRFESPALMDSISADLMSKAGVSDAAAALRLVAGASVQDGKSAVIRGLPDRYVSSQMNGVTLPTADEDKRAVELDQFPSAVIESIQVSKTFTPDQQGDASGGAVNVRLKGLPDEAILQFKGQLSANSQVYGENHFLTYQDGGVNHWGNDHGDNSVQSRNIGDSWTGAVGTSDDGYAPNDYKWSIAGGGKHELDSGIKLGGFFSLFYERDSAFYDDGINDSYWVENPGDPLTPETIQGTPQDGEFKTALYDVTQGKQSVQWGGLATVGLEFEHHAFALTYLYTRTTEDVATLAEDTRGKEYYFPGYDPNDPTGTGNTPAELNAAPYIRNETLEYTERTTDTLQLTGRHELPFEDYGIDGVLDFLAPRIDWLLADSSADVDQPDKRQFGAYWLPPSFNPGAPPFLPPFTTEPTWYGYKPSANFTLGNMQRIYKSVAEESQQYAVDLKLPFTQWSESEGYLKTGLYDNEVKRTFDQDTFSNFDDNSNFIDTFDDPWSDVFPFQDHPVTESLFDVDYKGDLDITAWYGMFDLPLTSWLNVIGGARYESTDIQIINQPEQLATWFPPGSSGQVKLNPGDGDVKFGQNDVLPAVGLVLKPLDPITFRASYAQTVARQTFKELTPILQQEYLGAPIFIGNPDLGMSDLKNYDLRLDYVPYEGSLVSVSWFKKDIDDPIEYVQRFVGFTYTTAVNYPEGTLDGWEFEVRQDLGLLWEPLGGFSVGANATFIESEVTLPAADQADFSQPTVDTPIKTRDMTNAPDHLYNLYATYDLEATGTQFAVFYTIQGDTLIAGAGVSTGNFVPDVYAKQYDTLNLSITQSLGEHLKLQFQAKNLTNPEIETVYRSDFTGGDVKKTSYTSGIEYSIALGAEFRF